MKHLHITSLQNSVLLFIIIAPFTIAFYASYVFNPLHIGNLWLYVLLLIADGIAIINLSTLWLTILLDLVKPQHLKREFVYHKDWLHENSVKVDILLPVYNESLEIIKKTVEAVVAMDYPHTTYILDDGYSEDVKALAQALQVYYIARPSHAKGYAKSGNLNYALKCTSGEFFAVFDADHAPHKTFLTELLPFFENKNIALVQTPQHYINTDNFIAGGTAQAQEIFYKYVQPAKNSYNASFCVGTNMLYRRSTIEDVGGIALMDHSEDIWTTIMLHEKGYESVFYNKVLAFGRAPETVESFFRQQNRWARGGFALFFLRNPLFSTSLTLDQKVQYFFSNIHYFTAFSVLIYLLLPIIYLLTNQHPMNVVESYDWPIHFFPYFLTVYFLPYFLLGNIKLSTISTAFASFYPYIEAFASVVLKSKYKWIATETSLQVFNITMRHIWPHILLILLAFFSMIVGWYNVVDLTTTSIVTFWAIVNSYLLFIFIKNGLFAESIS